MRSLDSKHAVSLSHGRVRFKILLETDGHCLPIRTVPIKSNWWARLCLSKLEWFLVHCQLKVSDLLVHFDCNKNLVDLIAGRVAQAAIQLGSHALPTEQADLPGQSSHARFAGALFAMHRLWAMSSSACSPLQQNQGSISQPAPRCCRVHVCVHGAQGPAVC